MLSTSRYQISMYGPRKKSALEIVLTVVACFVGAWAGMTIYQYVHDQWKESHLEQVLTQASADQNKGLPKMVSSITRLDSTSAGPGRVVGYHYTLMSNGLIDKTKIVSELRPGIVEAYRNNPGLSMFRDNGVTMVYDYFDQSGDVVAEIKVGPKDLTP
jgi:hypothetical protein